MAASIAPLHRLLRPRSVAVIGGVAAARVAEQCERMGFDGEVWPVHPTRSRVAGRSAYRCVEALPRAPDAAFVGVNRHAAVEAVAALADTGAGGAICYAAGFLEAGGADLQEELVAAAAQMPLVGPNCYGLINFLDGVPLWPDQHGGKCLGADGRGVAIVMQSSNVAISVTMQRRGLPIAYMVTAGNQAQLGLSQLALALLEDDRVSAIGLHVEAFDSIAGMEALAGQARARRVPVVALKVGRSTAGSAAALSHTASIAGADAGAEALLSRLGVARAHGLADFVEALKFLHAHGPLRGRRIGSLSCSGGEAGLMADAVANTRLSLPALTSEQAATVAATTHPLVHVANPLDYHTFSWGDEAALTATFSAFAAAGFDANVLVLDVPRADRCDDADWQVTARAFEQALLHANATGAVLATLAENMPESWAEALLARGIAPLCGLGEGLAALEAAAFVGTAWQRPAAPPAMAPVVAAAAPQVLDEAAAKARLRRFGVAVPAGGVARDADAAVALAATLGGAVVMKALGVAHKTEQGAVRIGLRGEAQVRAAAQALLPLGDGLLVERHVGAAVCELIVGLQRDAQFGILLTVGSGGVLVELAGDSVTLLLPTSAEAVRDALAALRCAPLLHGYRGQPAGDVEAAVAAVLAVASFGAAHPGAVEELDVNPLAVLPEGQGAMALDALIRIREGQ